MHRFVVNETLIPGCEITLNPEESKHLARVLRLTQGDEIELLGGGERHLASVLRAEKDGAAIRVLDRLPSNEPDVRLTLFQGMPKAEKMEWIAQKATELGASEIVPVVMERSVARPDEGGAGKRTERLFRIAVEATKQCGRACTPDVSQPISWKEALLRFSACDLMLMPWEEARGVTMKDLYSAHPEAKNIGVLIGPEGGIAAAEAKSAEACGAKAMTLGPRILRAETAAIASVAMILTFWGDLS